MLPGTLVFILEIRMSGALSLRLLSLLREQRESNSP